MKYLKEYNDNKLYDVFTQNNGPSLAALNKKLSNINLLFKDIQWMNLKFQNNWKIKNENAKDRGGEIKKVDIIKIYENVITIYGLEDDYYFIVIDWGKYYYYTADTFEGVKQLLIDISNSKNAKYIMKKGDKKYLTPNDFPFVIPESNEDL